MSSRGFIVYLLSAFSFVVLSALFFTNHIYHGHKATLLASSVSGTRRVWPGLLQGLSSKESGCGGKRLFTRIETKCEPLIPKEEKTTVNDVEACSLWYWVLFGLQFPIALLVFGYEAVKLYREHKRRMSTGNSECICGASIEWTVVNLAFCAICGIVGGVVGGLLGSGGGFVLGPLLLEIGVIPQVASATATFVMMFSSSLSVVEFYLLKRFPIPYALYLTSVSILAGFWGQFFVRRIVAFLGRASLIVFILSGVIFASALTMGVVGIENSIEMINNHEFMGFLGFCSSQ
ncbi:hypothetical protein ACSQ67_015456 [Phaseolus vulgaris]